MSDLVAFVLALAVYRCTRLVTTDRITEPLREWVRHRGWNEATSGYGARAHEVTLVPSGGRKGTAARWVHDFVTCPWCVSVWVAGLAVGTYLSWPRPVFWTGSVFAASAAAGILIEKVA